MTESGAVQHEDLQATPSRDVACDHERHESGGNVHESASGGKATSGLTSDQWVTSCHKVTSSHETSNDYEMTTRDADVTCSHETSCRKVKTDLWKTSGHEVTCHETVTRHEVTNETSSGQEVSNGHEVSSDRLTSGHETVLDCSFDSLDFPEYASEGNIPVLESGLLSDLLQESNDNDILIPAEENRGNIPLLSIIEHLSANVCPSGIIDTVSSCVSAESVENSNCQGVVSLQQSDLPSEVYHDAFDKVTDDGQINMDNNVIHNGESFDEHLPLTLEDCARLSGIYETVFGSPLNAVNVCPEQDGASRIESSKPAITNAKHALTERGNPSPHRTKSQSVTSIGKIILTDDGGVDIPSLAKLANSNSPFKCIHCNYTTRFRSQFVTHRENHRQPGIHKCDICSYSSNSRQACTRHKNHHHIAGRKKDSEHSGTPDRLKRGLFSCAECLYKTYNRAYFVRHRRYHTIPNVHKCLHCSFSQPTKSAVASHISKYHDVDVDRLRRGTKGTPKTKSRKQKQCVEASAAPSRTKHCPHCDYKGRAGWFKKHLEHHGGSFKYQCNVCDYGHNIFRAFMNHMKYCCSIMVTDDVGQQQQQRDLDDDFVPSSQTSYKQVTHSITVKKVTNSKGVLSNRYCCPFCDYSCTKKKLCKLHMETHEDKTTNVSVCKRKGESTKILTVRGTRDGCPSSTRFLCPKCAYSSTKKMLCLAHLKTFHDDTDVKQKKQLPTHRLSLKQKVLKKSSMAKQSLIKDDGDKGNANQRRKSQTDAQLYNYRFGKVVSRTGTIRYTYMCLLCGTNLAGKEQMRRHNQHHRDGKLVYECPTCQASFLTDGGRRMHMKVMRHSETPLKNLPVPASKSGSMPFKGKYARHSKQSTPHSTAQQPVYRSPTNNASDHTSLRTHVRPCSVVIERFKTKQTARKQCFKKTCESYPGRLPCFEEQSPDIERNKAVASWLSNNTRLRRFSSLSHEFHSQENVCSAAQAMPSDLAVSSPYSISLNEFTACENIENCQNADNGLSSADGTEPMSVSPKTAGRSKSIHQEYSKKTGYTFTSRKSTKPSTYYQQHSATVPAGCPGPDTTKDLGEELTRGHVLGHGTLNLPDNPCRRIKRENYICNMCPQVFESRDDLVKHHVRHRQEGGLFLCSYCTYSATDAKNLLQHTESHFRLHQFHNAMGIRIAYRRPQSFNNMPVRTPDALNKCETKGSFDKRMPSSDCGEKSSDVSEANICRFCERPFASLALLLTHERCHLLGNEFMFCS